MDLPPIPSEHVVNGVKVIQLETAVGGAIHHFNNPLGVICSLICIIP